jgi:hypothetical protein
MRRRSRPWRPLPFTLSARGTPGTWPFGRAYRNDRAHCRRHSSFCIEHGLSTNVLISDYGLELKLAVLRQAVMLQDARAADLAPNIRERDAEIARRVPANKRPA